MKIPERQEPQGPPTKNASEQYCCDRLANCSRDELPAMLQSFTKWPWENIDTKGWIPVLNRFDQLLAAYNIANGHVENAKPEELSAAQGENVTTPLVRIHFERKF